LSKMGVKVVGVPKTVDNDVAGTDFSFGFFSAVEISTRTIEQLFTTAKSHDRVIVVEVMGRSTGWIALFSGMAGGANYIVIPEEPFSLDEVCALVNKRRLDGKNFAVIVVAEGAKLAEKEVVFLKEGEVDEFGHVRLGGIGQFLAREIEKRTGAETRSVALGHLVRGGSPSSFDRILATRFGLAAVDLVKEGIFGKMVSLRSTEIVPVDLEIPAAGLRTVNKALYDSAKIFFG
ncbi:MAG: 6-phosphofructokinase, partial [Aigarchaeota archaeon]|nr:6-phosphofructokinase [Aigarchaeota archaeon]